MSHFPEHDFENRNIPQEELDFIAEHALPPRPLTEAELAQETWTPETIRQNTQEAYEQISGLLKVKDLSVSEIALIMSELFESEDVAEWLSIYHSHSQEIAAHLKRRIIIDVSKPKLDVSVFEQVKKILGSGKLHEGARITILSFLVEKDLVDLNLPQEEAKRLLNLMHDIFGDPYPG